MSMSSLYRSGIAGESRPLHPYLEAAVEGRRGLSMIVSGTHRGRSSIDLYKSGLGADLPDEMIVQTSIGAVKVSGSDIKSGIIGFLIDVTHILLIIGGIYLVASAIWGVR